MSEILMRNPRCSIKERQMPLRSLAASDALRTHDSLYFKRTLLGKQSLRKKKSKRKRKNLIWFHCSTFLLLSLKCADWSYL